MICMIDQKRSSLEKSHKVSRLFQRDNNYETIELIII